MKEIKETQIYRKASFVYGLKELVLLKSLNYWKWSTDSMKNLLKSQLHPF